MSNTSMRHKSAIQIERKNVRVENNHKPNRKNGIQQDQVIKGAGSAFDYEGFAQVAGQIAFDEAKGAGLSEEVARKFEKIFGAPIEPEFRLG